MLLRSGDHLIATQGLYGGSYRVLTRVFQDFDVGCSFVDTSDMAAVRNAFRAETRAVFIETPSNPLMVISDIAALAGLAHEKGAIVMVDNTFMSPLLQRPLELGVDIVVHSATKFLGGHSDLVAGLAATKDESLAKRLKRIQNAVGAVPSPFDCWLLIRGMKTLGVRLGRSQENAQQIAGWLAGRPEVARVLYPGVEGLPGFDVHQRQADGPGAVLSFIVSEGLSAEAIVNSVSVWTLAVSLGAVESLIALPTKMTHLSYPREELNRLGLGDNLIRLSVGIEDPEDLIADLEDAFRTAKKAS
jgi:cystathionine beta-lyase/cystathionine gamma-synthase